jgi:hypothetical protein
MQRWRTEWLGFRDWQDGEIQRRMAGVCHALGRQYMTYSWSSNDGFWAACKDKIDVAFAGCPGNSVADSHYQKGLDEFAGGFRERTGLKRALGQRFVFFHDVNKDGWQAQVLSHDGFVQPKSWKTQVLRVVAALGGGVDLQNSFEFVAGLRYWLGEATRIISEFEPLFWEGERADDLATCDGLAYPNVLVLRRSDERLVLLFNEAPTPVVVTLRNRDVPAGQTATVYGTDVRTDTPAEMRLTVPAEDVAVVHFH